MPLPQDETYIYISSGIPKDMQGQWSGGICIYRLPSSGGELQLATMVSDLAPSFMAVHPNGRHMYAAHGLRDSQGQPGAGVSSFTIDGASGALDIINTQPIPGLSPSYMAIEPEGRWLIVSQYGTGHVVSLPIHADGSLEPTCAVVQHHGSSVNRERQGGPHAHSVVIDASGQFALVADLGLDKIMIYHLHAANGEMDLQLTGSVMVRPGSGPRHLVLHPNGRYLYCTNELDSTLSVLTVQAALGDLQEIQTVSLLPADFSGVNSPAHVKISPSGRFLYASNRGHDSIAIFAVDPESGLVTAQAHEATRGADPRFFAIDPSGQYLIVGNEFSDTVATFSIDAMSGELALLGMTSVPRPVFALARRALPSPGDHT